MSSDLAISPLFESRNALGGTDAQRRQMEDRAFDRLFDSDRHFPDLQSRSEGELGSQQAAPAGSTLVDGMAAASSATMAASSYLSRLSALEATVVRVLPEISGGVRVQVSPGHGVLPSNVSDAELLTTVQRASGPLIKTQANSQHGQVLKADPGVQISVLAAAMTEPQRSELVRRLRELAEEAGERLQSIMINGVRVWQASGENNA